MRHTTLIVPGFHGSGPGHWQTWLEQRLPDARRVRGVDWEAPVLARWAAAVRREIDESAHAVWLVAHSFGCLAGAVAAADRPERVAGARLVTPADPARFGPLGLLEDAPGPAGANRTRAGAVRSHACVTTRAVRSNCGPAIQTSPRPSRPTGARPAIRMTDPPGGRCAAHS